MHHFDVQPGNPWTQAVELSDVEEDARTQLGADRLSNTPHPDLPVLGGVELPAGHHATVAYAAFPDAPGSTEGELAARVFVVTAGGRWLTGAAGREREPKGALVHCWGGVSNSQGRMWCWMPTREVAAIEVALTGADGIARTVSADLLVDDPEHDARLFLAVIEGPEHVSTFNHLDEHGRIVEATDWRDQDESWHRRRAQVGTIVAPGTPPVR